MARVKFLVFALLVLVVWALQLLLLAPKLVKESVALAMEQAQASRPLAQAQIGERRQLLMRAVARLSAQARLASVVQAVRGTGKEVVTPEKLRPLRALAEEQVDPAIKDGLVFGFTWDASGIFFRGGQRTEELTPALGKAGQDGILQEAFGEGHLFISLPVWERSGGETKLAGTVVLGTPLLSDGMMDAISRDAGLAAAGVFQGGRLVQGGGVDSAALERTAKAAQLGSAMVVEQGETGSLGPLKLPLFTVPSDWTGGRAPLLIASRQAIEETPYEFIAIASVTSLMTALGAYQRFVLLVLGGLFLLTLVWTALMGSGEVAEVVAVGMMPPMEQAQERGGMMEVMPGAPEQHLASTMPDPGGQEELEDPRLAATIAQMVPPEPGLDAYRAPDFELYSEPGVAPPEPPPEPTTAAESDLVPPTASPFDAMPADPFEQYQAPQEQYQAPQEQYQAPQEQYQVPQEQYQAPQEQYQVPQEQYQVPQEQEGAGHAETPFASPEDVYAPPEQARSPLEASSPFLQSYDEGEQEEMPRFSSDPSVPVDPEDNPDATRVAMVSQELLAASARSTAPAMPASRQSGSLVLPRMPTVPVAQPSQEELHFQEVFRDFVATRERCGEGADGLTYDKFVQKLRKNKEQLVQKYGCKTVRFQVYVKEGKAALKASPVKD